MADESTPATVTVPTNSFTREPIAVAPAVATPVPTPASTTAPAATTDAAKAEPTTEAAIVAALAKANNEVRNVRKAESEFKTKIETLSKELETAREGSNKATQLESQIADMLSKPRKYLELFKAKSENKLAEILEGFAAEDVPESAEITELRRRLDAKDEAEKKAKEESDKANLTKAGQEAQAVNTKVNEWVASVISGDDGKTEDENGVSRWALISDDSGVPERARLEALKFATENKLRLNDESRKDLICQALDQMEKDARTEALAKAERLKIRRAQNNLTPGQHSYSLGSRQIDDRSSHSRAIDSSSIRGALPSPAKESEYSHGFTKRD